MKGFGMFMIAVCLMTVVSCSREDSIDDENVLTRSTDNDSTKQGSLNMTITINDEWVRISAMPPQAFRR